jgi:hypothetical protein
MFDISTPKKRERFLLVGGGFLLVVVIIPMLCRILWADLSKLRTQRTQLTTEIEKLEKDANQKTAVKQHLDDLLTRSLPSQDAFAQTSYQNWLMDLAANTGIRDRKIDIGSVTTTKEKNKVHYKKFTFTLHGKGKLEQLAEFLLRFHNTDYLHLVKKISPRPIRNSSELELAITVEAVSLPQVKSSRSLPATDPQKLKLTSGEREQISDIKKRALFTVYSPPKPPEPQGPPPPPPPPPPPKFDASPYCYVVAIVEADGKPQIWGQVRTEGKIYKLFEGEMFKLGTVRCFVKKIEYDRGQFEAAGGVYNVRIGKSFAEWDD